MKIHHYTVKNGEQYFTVSMITVWVTMETVKYYSPGVFSYTAFLQCIFDVCMQFTIIISVVLSRERE